jgi:transcription initiation factor TFIID subunit TAF12
MADNFIENILDAGCKIAKHKKSDVLTATDLKIAIGKLILTFQK